MKTFDQPRAEDHKEDKQARLKSYGRLCRRISSIRESLAIIKFWCGEHVNPRDLIAIRLIDEIYSRLDLAKANAMVAEDLLKIGGR